MLKPVFLAATELSCIACLFAGSLIQQQADNTMYYTDQTTVTQRLDVHTDNKYYE